ncbi:hypothetical protein EBR66_01405 [bacterium]|nr:hypothetical protein [bacterium]
MHIPAQKPWSVRRVDRVSAEIVLSNGVYLTFQVAHRMPVALENLIEVRRFRFGMQPGESILLNAHQYAEIRRCVVLVINEYRANYVARLGSLPDDTWRKPVQLRLW